MKEYSFLMKQLPSPQDTDRALFIMVPAIQTTSSKTIVNMV